MTSTHDQRRQRDADLDPLHTPQTLDDKETRIAIAGHPIHAMLVAFPIALTVCTLGADLFYWWTGDAFWARAGLWAIGMGFLMGLAAGVSGTVELLMVPGIRARAASWTHFTLAVVLLSMMGANFGLRLSGFEQAVLPWGILLSALCLAFTGLTGWHGGKLVFDYQLGTVGKGS
ncbi:DUF2231 domain-containing protein [Phreatobacter cathodiphilus]